MDTPAAIAVFLIVGLGAWLWLRGGRALDAESHLRRICLGDDGQVERLIDAETARTPGISRAEAATRAVRRYQRDNR